MIMNRNLSEKIAEWGLHNGYAPGELTVVNAVKKLSKESMDDAHKYYNRFRYHLSESAITYIENEVLNNASR